MKRLGVLTIILALCAAACGGADFVYFESITSGPNPGATLIVVWMSDSPADDADALEVSVARVELVAGNIIVPLATSTQTFDLLALQNGNRIKLAETNVAPASFDRIRLTLIEDGPLGPRLRRGITWEPLAFATPGGHVIDVPYGVHAAPDATLEIQIDFNARTSLLDVEGDVQLAPQLDALDPGFAGTIRGTVRGSLGAPLADAIVIAHRAGVEVRSTRTRGDGTYTLTPLSPGSYDLSVQTPEGPIAPEPDVAVTSGEITTVDFASP
ncbi:MAG: carboxypeptidase regulatory-like domain-containing protein [Planctomycetota bacterium]|nr:carboxypeptidase regulatory-like domain-containing protein [Planctomycetota bacterium]